MDDLAHIEDAELKAAILKVRKLDRILARKVKKERKIKRERIQLMRRLRQELENMAPAKGKEEKENNIQVGASDMPLDVVQSLISHIYTCLIGGNCPFCHSFSFFFCTRGFYQLC